MPFLEVVIFVVDLVMGMLGNRGALVKTVCGIDLRFFTGLPLRFLSVLAMEIREPFLNLGSSASGLLFFSFFQLSKFSVFGRGSGPSPFF